MSQQRTEAGKQNMLAALQKSMGIISDACKETGIPRRTFYNWMKTDTEFKEQVEDTTEDALDFAESQLLKRMAGVTIKHDSAKDVVFKELPPDMDAIKFFLVHKGKKRGWGLNQNAKAEPEKKTPPPAPVFILRPQGEKPDIIKYGEE